MPENESPETGIPEVATALSIAGSDPSGGAGIQADLRTFQSIGIYGMAVVTALTAQTPAGVRRVEPVNPDMVAAQLDAVLDDISPGAVKVGMLASAGNVAAVVSTLSVHRVLLLVVDPVIRSSSGEELLSPDGVRRLTADLLPMTRLLTPNLDEAAALSGLRVRTPEEMAEAARALHDQGAANVLVKGGHLDGGRVIDVLFDGSNMVRLVGDRIAGPSPHGTGCVLSSAIAAYLALGHDLASAVSSGNAVVRRAIRNRLIVGQGWPVCDPIGLGDLARPAPHAP